MATVQCKMCGGTLDIPQGVTAGECPYCGSATTYPKLSDDRKESLYNRAEHQRRQCDFDRALEAYEKILDLDPSDPEIYWGMVLCRYGIEYVEDPVSHDRIPTCHRVQLESILQDSDYLAALKHAGGDSHLYEDEAKRIAEIQKGILRISAQEKPYDVFICYKETTEGGSRTPDSVIAQDIYYQLTNEKYRVFFARITLEDKLGQQYEPYIFAALQSAKVMLVIGSKKEYFEAVWVKNEWSRFLSLMKKDRSKMLIPCYKDMDAYDIPDELSMLQSQDMSKIGFIQDLLRGIGKVVNKKSAAPAAPVTTAPAAASNQTANLLKRARLFWETGDFAKTLEYCEQVLDSDAENGEAYFLRLLAERKIRKEEELVGFEGLEEHKTFQLAKRFADSELASKLDDILRERTRIREEKILLRKKKEAEEEAERQRRRQEEEAERQRRSQIKRILLESRERKMRLSRYMKAEIALHGGSRLLDLLKCIQAEDKLMLDLSPSQEHAAEVKIASEEAMAQVGNLEELERLAWEKKKKRILQITLISIIVTLLLTVLVVCVIGIVKERRYIAGELAVAREAIELSDWDEVLEHTNNVLAKDPENAEAKTLQFILSELDAARKAEESRQWNEILEHANNVLAKDPENAEAKAFRDSAKFILSELDAAQKARESHAWDEVLEHANNVLEKDPENIKAKAFRNSAESIRSELTAARKALKSSDWIEAFEHAKNVLVQDSENAEAKSLYAEAGLELARKARESSDWNKFFEHTKDVLDKVPDNAEAKTLYAEAGLELARKARESSDWNKFFEHTKDVLDKAPDNVEAQNFMGVCYFNGQGVEKDPQEAVKWYRKAADQGDAAAQCNLGYCYSKGLGVEKDPQEAVKWYRKAAEQGHAGAQNNLGYCYSNGIGVSKDEREAVKWYRKAAEQGDADAQFNLGVCYFKGQGVEKDPKEAVKWYRKAAEQGNADAQAAYKALFTEIELDAARKDMGSSNWIKVFEHAKNVLDKYPDNAEARNYLVHCSETQGVPQDTQKAAKWYRKAVEQGDAAAQTNLGVCYFKGLGVEKDPQEAVKWYRKAADQEFATAQFNLGICYFNGQGVEKDPQEAVKWYRKAAKQGNADAQFNLGVCYFNGQGVMEKNPQVTVKWYRKAAEQGHAGAQVNLGVCYFKGLGVEKDPQEAVKWYRKAAEQGNANAQCNLGYCYSNGIGVSKDEREAVKWYQYAAAQGHAWAQNNLGYCYSNGIGVSKDEREAVKWYRKAAEQGDADAQFNLGVCYFKGQGVEKDPKEAVKWYRKAAEQGDAAAQCNLGSCYEFGRGVGKDPQEAVKWYRKAAEQGHANAQCNLGWCYNNGQGVPKDEAEAVKWFRKAAEQGYAPAQKILSTLTEKDEDKAKPSDSRKENIAETNIELSIPGILFFADLKDSLSATRHFSGSTRRIHGQSQRQPDFSVFDRVKAVRFRGDPSQGILFPYKPPAGKSSRTISVWFCITGYNRHDGGNSILSYGHKDFDHYFDIETNRAREIYCAWGTVNPFVPAVSQNRWHHLAVTYDGETQRTYLDGQRTSSYSVSLKTDSTYLMIGTRLNDSNHCFVGYIRNVAIYNRNLRFAEIQKIAAQNLHDTP